MGSALRVVGRSFRDWWDEMFLMVGINLLWALLAIPVVTFFPALMGVYNLTYEKAQGRRVERELFWQGFRRYFGKSWALGAINTVATLLLIVNIWFYLQFPNWMFYFTIIWVYVLVVWLVMQVYVYPLAIEQEDKSLKTIYLNAFRLALVRPLFTIVVGLILLVLEAVSIAIPPLLLLVFVPLAALIGNHALQEMIAYVQQRQEELKKKSEKK
jgi:uncharacterized membrane protein YesL